MKTLITLLMFTMPAAPASPGGATATVVAKSTTAAVQKARAKKLERYILRVNTKPKIKKWAGKLARHILLEARRFKLDPALFAAIAHNESWYDIDAKGKSYEYGAFQLWYRAYYLRPAWDRMRAVFQGKGMPDKDWNKLTRKEQIAASRNPRTAAFMAAFLVRLHVDRRCKKKQTPYCLGHYNSGNRKPRKGYVAKLRKRARVIRKALR
jgi:hypothetical protein